MPYIWTILTISSGAVYVGEYVLIVGVKLMALQYSFRLFCQHSKVSNSVYYKMHAYQKWFVIPRYPDLTLHHGLTSSTRQHKFSKDHGFTD